jgi:moderate conductance mechanosensitive channel
MIESVFPSQPQCVADAGSWCATFYQFTDNDFLARSADTIVSTSLQIAFIVVLALIARWAAHRFIRRLIEGAVTSGVSRLLSRAPRAADAPPTTLRKAQRARTIGSLLRSISSAVILTVATIMVLGTFGLNLAPILASAGIVGVAVAFGAQNLVRDFISGMLMLLEDQFGVGDTVDVGGTATGVVEAVGLRITTLRGDDGTVWYVRNGEIQRVGNKSQGFALAVVDLPVAHHASVPEAVRIAGETATERLTEEDVAADVVGPLEPPWVQKIGPEGVTLRSTVRVAPGKEAVVQRALYVAITDAFDGAGVPRPGQQPSDPAKAAPAAS